MVDKKNNMVFEFKQHIIYKVIAYRESQLDKYFSKTYDENISFSLLPMFNKTMYWIKWRYLGLQKEYPALASAQFPDWTDEWLYGVLDSYFRPAK